MAARIDDPNLDIDEDCAIVLQSAGPQGAPGMPEWGQLPIPQKLLKKGVRDMLRISDARMSGTSYGACVLHVTPESHVGGPLALVRDGDRISIDVRGATTRPDDRATTSWRGARRNGRRPGPSSRAAMAFSTSKHIQQADKGCDFDFLEPGHAEAARGRPEISLKQGTKEWNLKRTSKPRRASAPREHRDAHARSSSSAAFATSSFRACAPADRCRPAATSSARPTPCATSRRAKTWTSSAPSTIPSTRNARRSRPFLPGARAGARLPRRDAVASRRADPR